jgi:hypothetical protein
MLQSGYSTGSAPAQGVTASEGVDHARLKKDYLSYLELKNEEIKEQQEGRRYYHGAHWTDKQIKALNSRRQPVVTYNRIGRKINAIVGLLERQKSDPKGFPRTPKHEEGAEIATAVLRYVCDEQEWGQISPEAGLDGAVDGIGGVELLLEPGDNGDVDVGMDLVDPSGFFYDPRSLKPDFSDARYMGIGKWAELESAIEMFPDKEQELRDSLEQGTELTSNPDHDDKWYAGSENYRRIRIVDHWYIKGGEWHYCVYTGSVKLDDGVSPFRDHKGKTFCKYVMYSANVDHDGDRYGFVRNMKSANDEINQRRSKGLHLLNSRRIIMEKGAQSNVERIRKEAARPDGVIEYEPGTQAPVFDDAAKSAELTGQLNFLQDAKDEIENYGFNPALIGTGVNQMSGKAIQLQQMAGIAELGPYMLSFKNWKLRVYRAIWNIVRDHWKAERWIRVTDDEQVAQFFAVNQMAAHPVTGMPTLVNALGSLDVDIIIDEGPDTVNMQMDQYETLQIMARNGANVPLELQIEMSPVAASVKKKWLETLQKAQQQQMQMQAPAMQIEMQDKQAQTEETRSKTILNMAKAQKEAMPEQGNPGTGMEAYEAAAAIKEKQAGTALKMAQAEKTAVETRLLPMEFAQDAREAERSREERFAMKRADLSQQPAQ